MTFNKHDLLNVADKVTVDRLTKVLWQQCPSKASQKRIQGKLHFVSTYEMSEAMNSCKLTSNYADKEIQQELLDLLNKYVDYVKMELKKTLPKYDQEYEMAFF